MIVDGRIKGIPPGIAPIHLSQIVEQGWSLLVGDVPLPSAVLRESALRRNAESMRGFLESSGALLCPHGKTTMSPQLFERQLRDGAWGITVSTVQQLCVARKHGCKRVLLANQIVGRSEISYVLDELRKDPGFDFFCLVDSLDGVARLVECARGCPPGRPLQVLVEGGYVGGRAGCRSLEEALRVARSVRHAEPLLVLRGVEGYEGTLQFSNGPRTIKQVETFVKFLVSIASFCAEENLCAPGPILISAGGSAFYDLVSRTFNAGNLGQRYQMVLRSGCYLIYDHGMYRRLYRDLLERYDHGSLGPNPVPAVEIWTYVQSVPEPHLAILTAGRRDCGHDAGLPVPIKRFRLEEDLVPIELTSGYAITAMNDQHAYLQIASANSVRVGDMIALGVSHPCTTFDKWRILFVVDDDYRITSAIETFF
jgi:D-serine dehydratase